MDLCGEWEPPQRVQIKKEKKFMNRGKMKIYRGRKAGIQGYACKD